MSLQVCHPVPPACADRTVAETSRRLAGNAVDGVDLPFSRRSFVLRRLLALERLAYALSWVGFVGACRSAQGRRPASRESTSYRAPAFSQALAVVAACPGSAQMTNQTRADYSHHTHPGGVNRIQQTQSLIKSLAGSVIRTGGIFFLALNCASALDLEVEGIMKQSVFDYQTGQLKATAAFTFMTTVLSNRYLIITRKLNNIADHECPEEVTGSDGLDHFNLTPIQEPAAFITVASDVFPQVALTSGQVLWLAFAAERYLDDPRKSKVISVLDINPRLYPDSELRDNLQRFPEPPRAPARLEIFSPPYHYADGSSDFRGKKILFRKPYDNGYKMGEYVATATTNINHYRIPVRFELSRFVPKDAAQNRDDVAKVLTQSYAVTRVSTSVTPAQLVPEAAKELDVTDYRFAADLAGRPLVYSVTNMLFRDRDDPVLAREISKAKANLRVPVRASRVKQLTWLAILALLFVCPIVALFVRSRRQSVAIKASSKTS